MALLAALGHVANLGQFVEIGQGHRHQKEQIRWTKRNYELDSEALKIDLLGAARDDVRGTYDTYVERLDSLLLLNALLLPFALTTLQFSDQFVPGQDCLQGGKEYPHPDDCIEAKYIWIHTIWVYLVGLDLFIPFWSIVILLHCKKKLDNWLQETLDDLQMMRRAIISTELPDPSEWSKKTEEALAEEQKRIVSDLGGFIVDYQDLFMELWNSECAPRVKMATWILWSSAYVAVVLTSYMFWIYLINRDIRMGTTHDQLHFVILSLVCLAMPTAFFARQCCKSNKPMPTVQALNLFDFGSSSRDASRRSPLLAKSDSRASSQFLSRTAGSNAASSVLSRGSEHSIVSRGQSREYSPASRVQSHDLSSPASRVQSRDSEPRPPRLPDPASRTQSRETPSSRTQSRDADSEPDSRQRDLRPRLESVASLPSEAPFSGPGGATSDAPSVSQSSPGILQRIRSRIGSGSDSASTPLRDAPEAEF